MRDPSITIDEVNKSLNWLTKTALCQEQIDRRQRLLYRKTQFRDQLTHHDNTVTDNNCVFCKKTKKIAIKECVYHALWQCDKIKNLYENVAKELGIEEHTSFPWIS